MSTDFKSKALEANLAETSQTEIELPARHQWFVSLSDSYWGINKRTDKFITEYNHPYPDYAYIIESLHTISVNDLWLYSSIEEAEESLLFLVEIFEDLLCKNLDEKKYEQLVRTLFKFIDRLINEGEYPKQIIWKCMELIERCMAESDSEVIFLRNSGYFKMYLNKAAAVSEFNPEICRLTKEILLKSCDYWETTTNAEAWFADKADLFEPICKEKIKMIGKDFFADLRARIESSQTWEEIKSNLFFDEIANHFRHFIEEFENPIEKIYYILYELHLPGMEQIKTHLLYDLNRLIKAALSELEDEEIYSFVDMMFNLFNELKGEHTGIILDCQFTLGKELSEINNENIIIHFIQKLTDFGFVHPGKVKVTSDWVTEIDPNHVKNIRMWLDLIKTSPYKFKKLLSALVVNLKVGGIFISDTDLFQRDITDLLNADIAPVFKQVKQLARLFPVYYNEIGAEGKLRDVSTAMDELSGRQDRLIHYVRKQIHAESNNMHIELINRVAAFWYSGDLSLLQDILPQDAFESIDVEGEHFIHIHNLVREVCAHFDVDYAGLLKLPEDEVTDFIQTCELANEKDRKRLMYMIQLNRLLLDKYSLEVRDIVKLLSKSNFFSQQDIDHLGRLLFQNRHQEALKQIYSLMETLKETILSDTITEATENIYYKRHIAVGIPSMYGQYKEPKFDALGLIYRLEHVASRLIEKILCEINLEYISAKTLNNIYEVLILFQQGLELDGVVNQNFNSTLKMFQYSLTSSSVTLGQYMNIFSFMSQNIRELINEYFMRVYDETISIVTTQIYDDSTENITNVSEIFYRDILSTSFLIQELDQFLANLIYMIDYLLENYSEESIQVMMSYNPDLAISPLDKDTPEVDNRVFLGAKAFYLKKLTWYDLPIPPGFVLTTEVYRHKNTILKQSYMNHELEEMVLSHIRKLEAAEGLKYGNTNQPLLLSVRSGTVISMPGAMSTYLNIGMNEAIAEALGANEETAWMSWDAYRRLVQSWGMSQGLDRDLFDAIMVNHKKKYNVAHKAYFSAVQMKELAKKYQEALHHNGIYIVEDPWEQLKEAIINVFDSWSSERTKAYRRHMQIADEWGTAVILQKMVMGNRSHRSGSGVVFTHNPKLKKPGINLYGDFTICSQGEDVVSGLVYTLPISESQREGEYQESPFSLQSEFPEIYQRLHEIATELKDKYGFNHQEIEFTFESDKPEDLYILQIREQNIIQNEEVQCFIPDVEEEILGKGIGIGGGCMSGIISFDIDDLHHNKNLHPEEKHILIRPDTVPDDIHAIFMCDGLVTSRGGVTSHAAVTAQKLGKVCIVNCKELVVDESQKQCRVNNHTLHQGDKISIDGIAGIIY